MTRSPAAAPRLPRFVLLAVLALAALSGCSAVATLGYDEAVQHERAQCERYAQMSDRQACLQRVNTAARQAEAERAKR